MESSASLNALTSCSALLHFSLQLVKAPVLPGFEVVSLFDKSDGRDHAGSCSQSASYSSQGDKHWGD